MSRFNKTTAIIILIALCLSLTALSGCEQQEQTLTHQSKTTFDYFGTVSRLVVFDDFTQEANMIKLEKMWSKIKQLLKEIDSQLSLSIPESDIARFNEADVGEEIYIGEHTAAVIEKAFKVHGKYPSYEPSVAVLVDLWALSPRFNDTNYKPTYPYDRERVDNTYALPEQKYIDSFLRLTDFSSVMFDKEKMTLSKTLSITVDEYTYTQKLDFGGLAKGYAADKVLELMKEYGYEYGYFSCGTSSIVMLDYYEKGNNAAVWKMSVQNPRFETNQQYVEIYCKNLAVSTSGDYQNMYYIGDARANHIIDPKTGYPYGFDKEHGIATVTVLGKDAAYLDALSTVLCLMSVDELLSAMNSGELDCYVIAVIWAKDNDYCEVITNMPENMYKIKDYRFVVKSIVNNGQVEYIGDFALES
jgi:thiamine biosynthesis lipoprotein